MAASLVSIQIIPKTKNGEDSIPYVDEAIKVIEESGVKYAVNPLETTMEGELPELLGIIEKMHRRMEELGIDMILSQVKIASSKEGLTMDGLTVKYR